MSGRIERPSDSGFPLRPRRRGTDGPYISASRTPTRQPSEARPSARLTQVVDLPTPPLPEATAMMLEIPGMAMPRGDASFGDAGFGGEGLGGACFSEVRLTSALATPANFLTAASAAARIGSSAADWRGSTAIDK